VRVALKLLQSAASAPQSATRLEFEASVLAKLQHPNIVSYIAHGRTPSGLPFLAMEWLQGEDLAHRLRRSLLTLPETLLLLQGVASALAAAHRSGVIHRDIKPSNLFLPGGRIDQVKLLDFGIAREELAALALTRTGSILGTLEYMAPEQARGARNVGPSADIFSLGCVLYECLTGRPPLQRVSFPEMLIRMLTEEFPPIDSIRPGLPKGLLTLLQRMFAKVPEQRPQDGDALLRELDLLSDEVTDEAPATLTIAREPFTQLDQRLLCVVLASGPGQWSREPTTLDTTESAAEPPPILDPQDVLLRWGALTEWLSDGSLLITLTERGTASDLAAQAARVALQLSQLWRGCTAILATGLGSVSQGSASGQVVRRVLDFMHAQRACELPSAVSRGEIWLDGVTAGLVDGRFIVHRISQGLFALRGELDSGIASRPLAGLATACIGRERELSTLTALLQECVDESMARATLLVAQHGRGKSRLRHELLSRLRTSRPDLTVLLGHGDAFCAAVEGSLLTDCLRRLAAVEKEDGPEQTQAKLSTMLRQLLPPDQLGRYLLPLLELGSQRLFYDGAPRATLPDCGVHRDHFEQAFVQLMLALSAAAPILLVLENVQWADALSVRIISRVLSELAERPLMVLALARPEVHAIFPQLWAEHRVQELRLEPLLPSSCEQLIYSVLGPEQGALAASHILEHGRGNALFVEELILHGAADPATRQLPATLITLEQGRLLRLPSPALRVLRAASVFGLHFWEEGIYSLLSSFMASEHIEIGLQTLLREDLIARARQSRFPHTPEFRFRHALTLAAAVLLLSAEDRELSRTLVARYL
jgi:eukaryotic-like serine/threonine-protein kinase